jgi:hypothetical protein
MVLLQKYADILIGAGWFPVLDNINKDFLQYTVAKHQIPADLPTPARLFGFKKSMPLGYKETVTEEIRKFRDKIITPQEATLEDFEHKITDKGDEDSDSQNKVLKEFSKGQGLDSNAETVNDEGSNGDEVNNKNNATSKCKCTLQQQADEKKGEKCIKRKN